MSFCFVLYMFLIINGAINCACRYKSEKIHIPNSQQAKTVKIPIQLKLQIQNCLVLECHISINSSVPLAAPVPIPVPESCIYEACLTAIRSNKQGLKPEERKKPIKKDCNSMASIEAKKRKGIYVAMLPCMYHVSYGMDGSMQNAEMQSSFDT